MLMYQLAYLIHNFLLKVLYLPLYNMPGLGMLRLNPTCEKIYVISYVIS